MWKVLVLALAAALLVIGVSLVRGMSSEPRASASSRKPVAAPRLAHPSQVAMALPLGSAAPADPAEAVEPVEEPATRGPAAPVWKVLGTPHANAVEARDEILAALKAAPACGDAWCTKARATLDAWSATVASKVPGALSPDLVQCGAAGCWLRVTLNEPRKWREVTIALSTATMEHGWTGPSVLSEPDFQARPGPITALWVLLPLTEGNET